MANVRGALSETDLQVDSQTRKVCYKVQHFPPNHSFLQRVIQKPCQSLQPGGLKSCLQVNQSPSRGKSTVKVPVLPGAHGCTKLLLQLHLAVQSQHIASTILQAGLAPMPEGPLISIVGSYVSQVLSAASLLFAAGFADCHLPGLPVLSERRLTSRWHPGMLGVKWPVIEASDCQGFSFTQRCTALYSRCGGAGGMTPFARD